jgi:hypothetical protein
LTQLYNSLFFTVALSFGYFNISEHMLSSIANKYFNSVS